VEAGYGFSSITKQYDDGSAAINLRDEGIAFVRHAMFFEVGLGILNNLTLNLSSSYKGQTQRYQEVVFSNAQGVLTRPLT
jgi:hypothetical protein